MAIIIACDACGDEVEERATCLVRIMLPAGVGAEHDKLEDKLMFKLTGRAQPETHDFQLCGECAASMALTLHQGKGRTASEIRASRS